LQRRDSLQQICMTARRLWILAGGALALTACARDRSCDDLAAAHDWRQAAAVCRDAYENTGDVAAGISAARSLLWSGRPEHAEDVARTLRASERAGDAFLVLGEAAARRDDADAGLAAYDEALRAYERDRNPAGASRAALGVAGAWLDRGDLARAMDASQLAIDRADRAGDRRMQLYTRLGHADLLRHQGQLVAAEQALARAGGIASAPIDRAWLALKHGTLYVDLQLDALARVELQRVLALVPLGVVSGDVVLAARLNLAWIERRAGDLALAQRHVDAAAAIRADDFDVHVNRALILADRGDLDAAARELAAAERTASSVSSSSWIAYNTGVVAGRRGDLDGEAAAFQRSIDGVRALSSHAGQFAPDVAASHRRPYLRLIGAHARRGDWKAALGLVMELDSLALLATERAAASRPADPPARRAPASSPALPSVDAVVEAWRGRQLVIAVSDEETLWRIEVRDGRATGSARGPAAELEARARSLEADPTDAAAAAALGAAIAPPGVAGDRTRAAGGADPRRPSDRRPDADRARARGPAAQGAPRGNRRQRRARRSDRRPAERARRGLGGGCEARRTRAARHRGDQQRPRGRPRCTAPAHRSPRPGRRPRRAPRARRSRADPGRPRRRRWRARDRRAGKLRRRGRARRCRLGLARRGVHRGGQRRRHRRVVERRRRRDPPLHRGAVRTAGERAPGPRARRGSGPRPIRDPGADLGGIHDHRGASTNLVVIRCPAVTACRDERTLRPRRRRSPRWCPRAPWR
jgi:tetratricopeptide (TPR) repeat protein